MWALQPEDKMGENQKGDKRGEAVTEGPGWNWKQAGPQE